MDNFFDFGHATNESSNQRGRPARNQELDTQVIDFMRPDYANDEPSTRILPHFVDGLTISSKSPAYLQAAHTQERIGRTGEGSNDFSAWSDGARAPPISREYCQSKGIQCLVLQKKATQSISCTSCHALSQSCSLAQDQRLFSSPDALGSCSSMATSALGGSTSSLRTSVAPSESLEPSGGDSSPSKVGARFSRESVRVLKQWLSIHHQHPYPTDDEKEQLKRQTRLNKTQIANWLANARRRGKVRPPGSSTSHALDIPPPRSTPVSEPLEISHSVQITMSPNNPNRHLPTDEELCAQARWIIYRKDNDDDNNNNNSSTNNLCDRLTPADDAEWLGHFKRSQSLQVDSVPRVSGEGVEFGGGGGGGSRGGGEGEGGEYGM